MERIIIKRIINVIIDVIIERIITVIIERIIIIIIIERKRIERIIIL